MTSRDAFLRRVQEVAAEGGIDLGHRERAAAATAAVFRALHDELSARESRLVAGDLPEPLERTWQEPWDNSWLRQVLTALGGPAGLDRESFFRQVRHRMGDVEEMTLPLAVMAGIVQAVFTALRERLPQGHADMVAKELPMELRDLWQGGARFDEPVGVGDPGAPAGAVGEVPRGEWPAFLAGLSAHYQTSPVRISVELEDGKVHDLVTHLPLIGMEPEVEPGGVRAIDVLVGATAGAHPDHLMHRAMHPQRLLLQVNEAGYPRLLDIEQEDGTRTLIRFAA